MAVASHFGPGRTRTELRCADWSAFAGPGPDWAGDVRRAEARAETEIVAAIAGARGGTLDAVEPGWVRFLRRQMPVAAIVFRHCAELLEDLAADAPSAAVARGLSLQAAMQLRQAQAIVLYAMDMEARFGDMPLDGARLRWEGEPQWRATREHLAAVAALPDWGARLVAVNLCVEPLVGQLLRREIAMHMGPLHGDPVTAIVAKAGVTEFALSQAWSVALTRHLLGDPVGGPRNRELLEGWLAVQTAQALVACAGLAGLADHLPRPAPRGELTARVVEDHAQLVRRAGL